jgi:hypothetical protein
LLLGVTIYPLSVRGFFTPKSQNSKEVGSFSKSYLLLGVTIYPLFVRGFFTHKKVFLNTKLKRCQ